MRAFIVLCLVAVACADKLGYNYHPVDHSSAGLSFAPGGGSGSLGGGNNGYGGHSGLGSLGGGGGNNGLGSLGGGNNGLGSLGGGNNGLGSLGGGNNGLGSQGGDDAASNDAPSYAGPAEFEKEFFTYTANEDEFNDPAASDQVAQSLKQSLRVVFIKGPENKGLENAALSLAKHASEDRTAIYVLNKQTDIGELANKLNAEHDHNAHKPEVHFVKYRTPEDAANAQTQIQAQYDSLGGESQNHDGGVAPVLNFASQAPAAPAHAAQGSHGGHGDHGSHGSRGSNGFQGGLSGSGSAPSETYLPASIFRRFTL